MIEKFEDFPDWSYDHNIGQMLKIGNILYAFGGLAGGSGIHNPSAYTRPVEWYDETSSSWKTAPVGYSFPNGYYTGEGSVFFKIIAYNDNEAYMFGGTNNQGVCQDHVIKLQISGTLCVSKIKPV